MDSEGIKNEVDAFNARSYQNELYECALEKNSILVLGTGSGKTYISILLIKELGDELIYKSETSYKKTFFIVNTVPLVHQQAAAIERHTPYKVREFEGSMGVDYWTLEEWNEKLKDYDVIVTVAQILADLLNHRHVYMENINLLIMDECHHATGKHPMREIMRHYSEFKSRNKEVPRIMGLTACVILKRCKLDMIPSIMKSLEDVMGSALVTASDQLAVRKYATKAAERIIEYCPGEPMNHLSEKTTKALDDIQEIMIAGIESSYSDFTEKEKRLKLKLKKFIKRFTMSICSIMEDLGTWCLFRAVNLECEYLKQMEETGSVESELLDKFYRLLLKFDEEHNCSVSMTNPLDHSSYKVLRFIELLKVQVRCQKLMTIVFVERRNAAKLLHELLCMLAKTDENFSALNPGCIVGGLTILKDDIRQQMVRKQKEVMSSFRSGKSSLIVSTSVLEEGIDIPICNLIVRFNPPNNYRSYIQSIGRARAEVSHYILLVPAGESHLMKEEICYFKAINRTLTTSCHDRSLPSQDEMSIQFKRDEILPPFQPYGPGGPQVTFVSAFQLLNKYCGKLPQDKFSLPIINVKVKREGELVCVGLTLPISSPLKTTVWGKKMRNIAEGKSATALLLCQKLFEMNEFDNHLLPKILTVDENISSYLNQEEKLDTSKPQPGTRRRRQIYGRHICGAFTCHGSDSIKYLYYLEFCFHDNKIKELLGSLKDIGILTSELIEIGPMDLYSQKWGNLKVMVRQSTQFNQHMTESLEKEIEIFHCICYENILKINSHLMEFVPSKAGHSVLLVPLNQNHGIDEEYLKYLSKFRASNSWKLNERDYDLLKDCCITPSYRDSGLLYVVEVNRSLNPLSPFPESKKNYSTYKEYYSENYEINIKNDFQPLLECQYFSRQINYLTKCDIAIVPNRPKLYYVPELCEIIPVSFSRAWKIFMIPSILHRINGLEIEKELLRNIVAHIPPRECSKLNYLSVDFLWVAKEVFKAKSSGRSDNLCVNLNNKTILSVYPGMLLQALSPIAIGDNFNLERLEVLGDSFLKYIIGFYLFCEDDTSHEGLLSARRSALVSNKSLYLLARNKSLQRYYQNSFISVNFLIPYGYAVLPDVESFLREGHLSPDLWQKYVVGNDIPEGKCEDVYNPWSEQCIADKCVADCVEALIGVFLLCGGFCTAIDFMKWIGVEFIAKPVIIPSTASIAEKTGVKREADYFYRKYRLKEVEQILKYRFNEKSFLLQAMTHSSYEKNLVTDCYQRLEFLGDAVLDFLITGKIYENSWLNPGQLTDLRSHYVKNETLAKICIHFKLYKYMLHMAPLLDGSIAAFMNLIEEGVDEFNCESDVQTAENVEVPKALGDLIESLIGAVFLDSNGSLEKTWECLKVLYHDEFEKTKEQIPINPIRELYEMYPGAVFNYNKENDDDPKEYSVMIPGVKTFTASGKNKRIAKTTVAKMALWYVKNRKDIELEQFP